MTRDKELFDVQTRTMIFGEQFASNSQTLNSQTLNLCYMTTERPLLGICPTELLAQIHQEI